MAQPRRRRHIDQHFYFLFSLTSTIGNLSRYGIRALSSSLTGRPVHRCFYISHQFPCHSSGIGAGISRTGQGSLVSPSQSHTQTEFRLQTKADLDGGFLLKELRVIP